MFRISSIRLSNFKNTNYGEIDFHTLPSGASITGIYGQNGSGKTSIVQAIECIDHIFSSGKLPEDSIDYIGVQAEFATIEVVFDYSGSSLGEGPDGSFIDSVRYLTRIGRKTDGSGAFAAEEKIWVGYAVGPWRRRLLVGQESVSPKGIDLPFDLSFDLAPARAPVVYSPVDRWKSIQAISADVKTGLASAQDIAYTSSGSVLFSQGFITALMLAHAKVKSSLHENQKIPNTTKASFEETIEPLKDLIMDLRNFSICRLRVFSMHRSAIINLDVLPLYSRRNSKGLSAPSFREDVVKIDAPELVSKEKAIRLRDTISSLNPVLNSLVPGLGLEVRGLGQEVRDNGSIGERVEILSLRNESRIPFRCESEGIKKLVAILALLVGVYNDEDSCVVVDELDSGIFEFLLGEILEILAAKGKGQLIFTAHNLRPLEMLPVKSLVFTTVNPDERYLRFKGKKATNNLRDQYLRAINLGGQKEHVYDPTDSLSIDAAFYEAGHSGEDLDFDILLQNAGGNCGS